MGVLGERKGIALTGPAGRSILEFNRYVRRIPLEAGGADLLSFHASRGLDFDSWNAETPDAVWARFAADPATRVLFDASGEGTPHHDRNSRGMHSFLRAKNIPLERAVYLTQYRPYAAEYEAACRAAGEPGRMRILNADYYIRRFFLEIADGEALFEARLQRYRARPVHRERAMINLNLTPRRAKVVFLLRLLRDGLWDKAFLSVGDLSVPPRARSATDQVWDAQLAQLQPQLEQLKALAPVTFAAEPVPDRNTHFARVFGSSLDEHDRSWFSVITETEMLDGPSRITEKPFKALVNFHPVIFLGSAGGLPLLRDLGFRTFEGFFDESYDEVVSAERRFDLVYEQVVRLLNADDAELARRTARVAEALEHNARWGLTQLPEIFRGQRDLATLTELLA